MGGLRTKKALAGKKPLTGSKPISKKSSVKKTKPKVKSISKLKKDADAFFSQATRLRFMEKDGTVKCITCPNQKLWKEMQCGHFMSRRFNSTRFEELNTAPQCYGCNVMHQGRQYEFGKALDEWYGAGTAESMFKLAQVPHQFNREELEGIIHDAKETIRYYQSQYPALVS